MMLILPSAIAESTEEPFLSLIIPTYNESHNISELFARIKKSFNHRLELIVVDDSSPDGTAEVAETLNVEYGNIKVLRRAGKLGLSSAVLDGFKRSHGNILGVIDADMQHPPEILPEMYNKISEGCDLVVASRYSEGGGIRNWKTSRIVYSKVAIILAHTLLPNSRRIKDVMSGCFMIRKEIIEREKLNPIGFKILLEIVAKCRFTRVAEVPYIFTNRRNGKSNLDLKEIRNYVVHLFRIFLLTMSNYVK